MPSRGDNSQAVTRVTLSLIKWNEIKGILRIHSNMYKSMETMPCMRLRISQENDVSLTELGELPKKLYVVTSEIVKMSRQSTLLKKFYMEKNKWRSQSNDAKIN